MASIANITTKARSLVDADSTSLSNATMLIEANQALMEIAGELMLQDRTHAWGDSNFTSLPTGLVTLVNSTEAYQLSGNQTSTGVNTTNPLLTFIGASVKDNSGIWHVLEPITQWEITQEQGADRVEYFKTDGLPQYYEIREDFLILYPAPDNGVSVTLTSGLKIDYERRPSLFTDVTASTEPGFSPLYHYLMSYKMALPYALSYKKDRVAMIQAEIQRLNSEMMAFEAKKYVNDTSGITTERICYR